MTRACVLSPGAAADLREITRYTLDTWGAAQTRAYINATPRRAWPRVTALILAVLHERMDIIARLAARLSAVASEQVVDHKILSRHTARSRSRRGCQSTFEVSMSCGAGAAFCPSVD